MKDYRHILPAQMTGSQAFGLFLQRLRETGTVLPSEDYIIAEMIAEALDGLVSRTDYDDEGETQESLDAEETRDTLARDMEVIAEALTDDEEN